jgi:hypothetical protein
MRFNMSEPEYHPTEEDILVTMKYLRLNLPDYATPEKAIKLLNYQHAHYKNLEEMYPEEVERILKDLEEH